MQLAGQRTPDQVMHAFGANVPHSKGGNKIRSEAERSGNDAMDLHAIPLQFAKDDVPISVDDTTANQTDINMFAQPGAFHLVPGVPPIPVRDMIEDETDVATHNEMVPVRPKRPMVVSAVLAEHDNQTAPSSISELQHAAEADPVELTVGAFRRRACFLVALLVIVVVASTTIGAIVTTSHKTTPVANQNILFEEFIATLLPAESLEQATLDPKSPQRQALEWLQRDTNGSTMVGWRMLQRYSLSTVYFSLNGNDWYNRTGWLSDGEECSWNADAASCGVNGRIHSLQLSDNNLTGSIPHELSLLTDLETILLKSNSVTGTIPNVMFGLRQLTHLDVEDNLFGGTLPTEIGNTIALEVFIVAKNHLNGTLPSELGMLSDLRVLRIFRNDFQGPLPTTLALNGKVELLDADSNSFTGSLPTQLGRISNLKGLSLDHNQLSGTLPTELGRLQRLDR
jgi:Leucine-rich repeat (LRR) protein